MTEVAVLILHPEPAGRPGDIETWVDAARRALAERHRLGFLAAGATDATIVAGPPDGLTFGARLRTFLDERRPDGIVVLGSGAIPLAGLADRQAFVGAAADPQHVALANNRYSADVVAIADARSLRAQPALSELPSDNALPRWLAERAGWDLRDLRERWRLGFDIDGPLDLALIGPRSWLPGPPTGLVHRVADRLARVALAASDPAKELIVAGRTSAAALGWLERHTAARTRAFVEERGMRTAEAGQRGPRSLLGASLGNGGPGRLGALLAELGDAALVDSRVLIADHSGPDDARWPRPGDRFASDLLAHERVEDPWLRDLTRAAADAPIPIVLGGHSLVGPGLRLVLKAASRWT